ncbi:hypothetical protein HDU79_002632, partial [Rhizoclosmatium sp. JEL0117]
MTQETYTCMELKRDETNQLLDHLNAVHHVQSPVTKQYGTPRGFFEHQDIIFEDPSDLAILKAYHLLNTPTVLGSFSRLDNERYLT